MYTPKEKKPFMGGGSVLLALIRGQHKYTNENNFERFYEDTLRLNRNTENKHKGSSLLLWLCKLEHIIYKNITCTQTGKQSLGDFLGLCMQVYLDAKTVFRVVSDFQY